MPCRRRAALAVRAIRELASDDRSAQSAFHRIVIHWYEGLGQEHFQALAVLEQRLQRLQPRIHPAAGAGRCRQFPDFPFRLPEQRCTLRLQPPLHRLEVRPLRLGPLPIPQRQPLAVVPVQPPYPPQDAFRPLLQVRPRAPQLHEIPPHVSPAIGDFKLPLMLARQPRIHRVPVAHQHGPLLPAQLPEQPRRRRRTARGIHPQAHRILRQARPQPAARLLPLLRPHVHHPRRLVPVDQQRLLLMRRNRLLQRLEPPQQRLRVPQQRARRQAHSVLLPLPLEGPRRMPLPVHLQQEYHPHAQPVARPPKQRRLQRCHHFPAPRHTFAHRPVARSADAPDVPLDPDFHPLADGLAVARVGQPALRTATTARLRLQHFLAPRQTGPIHPLGCSRPRLPPALTALLRPLTWLPTARWPAVPLLAVLALRSLLAARPERLLQQIPVALLQSRILLLENLHLPLQLPELPRLLPLQCLVLRGPFLRPPVHALPVPRVPLRPAQTLQQNPFPLAPARALRAAPARTLPRGLSLRRQPRSVQLHCLPLCQIAINTFPVSSGFGNFFLCLFGRICGLEARFSSWQ